jgi:hypothetical protein
VVGREKAYMCMWRHGCWTSVFLFCWCGGAQKTAFIVNLNPSTRTRAGVHVHVPDSSSRTRMISSHSHSRTHARTHARIVLRPSLSLLPPYLTRFYSHSNSFENIRISPTHPTPIASPPTLIRPSMTSTRQDDIKYQIKSNRIESLYKSGD